VFLIVREVRKDIIDLFEAHCKGRFPREFCAIVIKKKGNEEKKIVHRNLPVTDAEGLYNLAEEFEFKDVYCSVFSYSQWHEDTAVRKQRVVFDTIYIDIDSDNLKIAYLEARKLVKAFLSEGIIPRIYFSGAKGFHIFIDFKPVNTVYVKEVWKFFVQRLANKLNLTCVDFNVIDLVRVSRLPFTINSKTGYKCVPLDPKKFIKTPLHLIIHYAKDCRSPQPIEIHESDKVADMIRRIDVKLIVGDAAKEHDAKLYELKKKLSNNAGGNNNSKNWRRKRIEYYANVLKEKGYLSADPIIVKIHSKNEMAQKHNNPGAIEHIARVHLVLLCLEEGMSDEEIHNIFKYAKDYDPKKTQYYIDYNRKWLEKKKKSEGADLLSALKGEGSL